MLVPFCDCSFSGRDPHLGPQGAPFPGVHNSGRMYQLGPSPELSALLAITYLALKQANLCFPARKRDTIT
jgi:hypothetical protein